MDCSDKYRRASTNIVIRSFLFNVLFPHLTKMIIEVASMMHICIYLRGSKLGEHKLLNRPIWLKVKWVPATEGLSVLLCQIDAKLRLIDDEEWPE